MDFKERYNKLKDKIIDNFDYWLNNYIAIDISEAGEVDYLITDIDEYYFYLELEQELKFCIDDIVDSNDNELLIKFIELKRILNTKILDNKHFKQEDLDEIYSDIDAIEIPNYTNIRLHSNLKNPKIIIDEIYKGLFNEEYIFCELNEFSSHFFNFEKSKSIEWQSSATNLLGLIHLMNKFKIISNHNHSNSKIAIKHFKSIKGKFNLESLQNISTRVMTRDDKDDKLYSVIKEMIFDLKKIIENN